MDFYLYTSIIRIRTKFNIFHHIKILTIISNIGFMIVHNSTYNTKNTFFLKLNQGLYGIYVYINANLNLTNYSLLEYLGAFYLRTCKRDDNGGHQQ